VVVEGEDEAAFEGAQLGGHGGELGRSNRVAP
jgi:hypothetical protein